MGANKIKTKCQTLVIRTPNVTEGMTETRARIARRTLKGKVFQPYHLRVLHITWFYSETTMHSPVLVDTQGLRPEPHLSVEPLDQISPSNLPPH